ncbi:MAG: hypothetical protein ACREP7_18435 [Lysobacter sp.]
MRQSAWSCMAGVVAVLTACTHAVEAPLYEPNTDPRHRYLVTVELNDSPGRFDEVVAAVRYRVGPDRGCLPDAEAVSGSFPTPEQAYRYPPLVRMSATRYAAQVDLDGMAAKDYFGKGVCSWVFEGVSFAFKATAAAQDTRFVASLGPRDFVERQPVRLWFKRKTYPRHVVDGVAEHGTPDLDRIPGFAASDLFSATLSAKELNDGHPQ